jgi:hypothetical protein
MGPGKAETTSPPLFFPGPMKYSGRKTGEAPVPQG